MKADLNVRHIRTLRNAMKLQREAIHRQLGMSTDLPSGEKTDLVYMLNDLDQIEAEFKRVAREYGYEKQ